MFSKLQNRGIIMNEKNNERAKKMSFASIYPLYVEKVVRKNRTQEELDAVLSWLTGYTQKGLIEQINKGATLTEFIEASPLFTPKAHLITGVICGIRVEEMTDPLMQKSPVEVKFINKVSKYKEPFRSIYFKLHEIIMSDRLDLQPSFMYGTSMKLTKRLKKNKE